MFAHFGVISKKLLIVVQLIMEKYSTSMGDEIYSFMFVMAHNKAGVKVVEEEIIRRVKQDPQPNYLNNLHCLYYLIINQID